MQVCMYGEQNFPICTEGRQVVRLVYTPPPDRTDCKHFDAVRVGRTRFNWATLVAAGGALGPPSLSDQPLASTPEQVYMSMQRTTVPQ